MRILRARRCAQAIRGNNCQAEVLEREGCASHLTADVTDHLWPSLRPRVSFTGVRVGGGQSFSHKQHQQDSTHLLNRPKPLLHSVDPLERLLLGLLLLLEPRDNLLALLTLEPALAIGFTLLLSLLLGRKLLG